MSERDSYMREAQEHYRIGKIYLDEATKELGKGEDVRDDRGIGILTDQAQVRFLAGLLCLGLGGGRGEHPVPVYR
jgi:hypothetical protein